MGRNLRLLITEGANRSLISLFVTFWIIYQLPSLLEKSVTFITIFVLKVTFLAFRGPSARFAVSSTNFLAISEKISASRSLRAQFQAIPSTP